MRMETCRRDDIDLIIAAVIILRARNPVLLSLELRENRAFAIGCPDALIRASSRSRPGGRASSCFQLLDPDEITDRLRDCTYAGENTTFQKEATRKTTKMLPSLWQDALPYQRD